MNTKSLNVRSLVLGCAVALIGYGGWSQSTPNAQQQNKSTLQKGHSLYKNMKMYDSKTGATETKPTAVGDRAADRWEYEFNRIKNPYTNTIPEGIRELELSFSENIAVDTELEKSVQTKSGDFSYWKSRGPFNVGGRTRALAIDAFNEDVIIAGGVSGGVWRSADAGQTWRKMTRRRNELPSITCIVQDTTSFRGLVWYYGSGERLGNSASAGGAFYQGSGVYKSTNGGRSWKLLEATTNEDIGIFNSDFDLINSIAINPINGDLYVATFSGLYRSQDEGATFTEVLDSGFDANVEVITTPSGKVYASIESDGVANAGFFVSTDGDTWTNITPAGLANYGRTVMEADPSDENTVYFFTQDLAADAFLFKYDATAPLDTAWTDLTANLPRNIGAAGATFNLQGGYNMVIKVHPTNPNLIIIGGTNLYRSTDGFTTPVGREGWIAGYSPNSSGFGQYTNQHPDQHNLIFYPSDPNKVLSANDGGVYVTNDITATNPGEPVDWIDLNKGYLTTQPYHVAFDPEPNSDDLVAGFQDNGTWFTNSTDSDAIWEEDFGGDGAYSAIADDGRTRYVSSQRGRVFRFNFDENGEFVSFTRVQPAGASGFGFIAPFILDKNNDNIMYMPAGNTIWRNNDLDEIPLFSNALATVNWVNLTNTATPSGSITALDVSKYPVANRLYFGTSTGLIYRMDNANIDGQEVVDISTGKGLPPGFVNDINVDPSNSDRVIVTFSNYNIPSLFATEDGGETWTNISGNLEENPDGSGNGPSVRSTAFLGSRIGRASSPRQQIFVATSTGLYYTNRPNGENTRWRKQSAVIASSVADEVVTRKDGFIALATHGNGLFSARFPINNAPLPESTLSVAYLLDDVELGKGAEDFEVSVDSLFIQSDGLPIDIELVNSNPSLLTATLQGNVVKISNISDAFGEASIALIAKSNGEQVSEGFTIRIIEKSIYEQIAPSPTSIISQFITDSNALVQMADDFTVPQENTWNIKRIVALGFLGAPQELVETTFVVYADENGSPGAEIYNSGIVVPVNDAGDFTYELPQSLNLTSGAYWLSVYANLALASNRWNWNSQVGGIGAESKIKDASDFFGIGATDWTSIAPLVGQPSLDQRFQLFGDIIDQTDTPVGNEVTIEEPLADIEADFTAVVTPNPSKGLFAFDFTSLGSKERVSLQVFDLLGKRVHAKTNINGRYVWDASNMEVGMYLVKVDNGLTMRIIKN